MSTDFLVSIGLETHVQLKTNSKIWCSCPNAFGEEPNTNVCPVCMGYPGALPVMNREAIRLTVMAGLMLGCDINAYSKFDRKSYFYPDMPKNYQISQYDKPLCLGGGVDIVINGQTKTIELTRIHLEEDVGKNTHYGHGSGVDFNRAGTPLMEIVTEPVMSSADEALAYVTALKQILLYGGISECNLEQGNLRCDINCSVRPAGQQELGVKTELKNMNTFKGLHKALLYEIRRQKDVIAGGGSIIQETRRWNDEAGITESMRTKEYAHDYRYFPDPDLMPVVLDPADVETWRQALPELPADRRRRYVTDFGLPEYDAGVLVSDKYIADFFEATAGISGNHKASSNWVMTELMRALTEHELDIGEVTMRPDTLAAIIGLIDRGALSHSGAKEVFNHLFPGDGDPESVMKALGLVQVSDSGELEAMADEVIAANEKSVQDYLNGKKAALQFLMGQVMRMSKGKANPPAVLEILKEKLKERA